MAGREVGWRDRGGRVNEGRRFKGEADELELLEPAWACEPCGLPGERICIGGPKVVYLLSLPFAPSAGQGSQKVIPTIHGRGEGGAYLLYNA